MNARPTLRIYNVNGNLTGSATRMFNWDALNRLREVRSSGGSLIATYYYDADGRRVRKDLVSGTDIDYLYDGGRAIEVRQTTSPFYSFDQFIYGNYLDEVLEYDQNNNYTQDDDCIGAADGYRTFHCNALYSVYAAMSGNKTAAWAYEYDPYGAHVTLTDGNDGDNYVNFNSNDVRTAGGVWNTILTFAYTGQLYDPESGLLYYKHRYYSPTQGRFVSRDPIGYKDGPSLQVYARSSPMTLTDPTGLCRLVAPPRVFMAPGTSALSLDIGRYANGAFPHVELCENCRLNYWVKGYTNVTFDHTGPHIFQSSEDYTFVENGVAGKGTLVTYLPTYLFFIDWIVDESDGKCLDPWTLWLREWAYSSEQLPDGEWVERYSETSHGILSPPYKKEPLSSKFSISPYCTLSEIVYVDCPQDSPTKKGVATSFLLDSRIALLTSPPSGLSYQIAWSTDGKGAMSVLHAGVTGIGFNGLGQ